MVELCWRQNSRPGVKRLRFLLRYYSSGDKLAFLQSFQGFQIAEFAPLPGSANLVCRKPSLLFLQLRETDTGSDAVALTNPHVVKTLAGPHPVPPREAEQATQPARLRSSFTSPDSLDFTQAIQAAIFLPFGAPLRRKPIDPLRRPPYR